MNEEMTDEDFEKLMTRARSDDAAGNLPSVIDDVFAQAEAAGLERRQTREAARVIFVGFRGKP